MLIENYLQQYQRMRRYLAHIRDQNRNQQEYIDDVWTFFQHCHHLREWIGKDPHLAVDLERVNNEYYASPTLQIVADLANRSKHFQFDRKPKVDADLDGVGVTVRVGLTELDLVTGAQTELEPTTFEFPFRIKIHNGDTFDGLQLAEDAVKEWDRIMQKLGIPTQ